MQVTLWQQFSSNHSNDFTIVGEFASDTEAQAAEQQIQAFLTDISNWIEAHPVLSQCVQENWTELLSTPERRWKKRYNVQWDASSLDWMRRAHELGRLFDCMSQIDHLVLLQNTTTTSIGYRPFAFLLTKLRAHSVYVMTEGGAGNIETSMLIQAPDKAIADEIEKSLRYYDEPFPWIIYFRGQLAENPEQLMRDATRALAWGRNDVGQTEYARAYERAIGVRHSRRAVIERDDLLLNIQRIEFGWHTVTALPAFIAWLRSKGCQFTYQIDSDLKIRVDEWEI